MNTEVTSGVTTTGVARETLRARTKGTRTMTVGSEMPGISEMTISRDGNVILHFLYLLIHLFLKVICSVDYLRSFVLFYDSVFCLPTHILLIIITYNVFSAPNTPVFSVCSPFSLIS